MSDDLSPVAGVFGGYRIASENGFADLESIVVRGEQARASILISPNPGGLEGLLDATFRVSDTAETPYHAVLMRVDGDPIAIRLELRLVPAPAPPVTLTVEFAAIGVGEFRWVVALDAA